MKYVPPSVRETAFNCPHCGALAAQSWHKAKLEQLERSSPLPTIIREEDLERFKDLQVPAEKRTALLERATKFASGKPSFHWNPDNILRACNELDNVSVSRCYNCKDIALWIYEGLIYPRTGGGPPPNPDMPPAILKDYLEASAILELSPRGAAALMRLCIQKLCKELGEKGDNINEDIASLVAKGLDERVKKALDAVRVIGNNAVHPGKLDLTDDRATAESLFKLLNLIVEKMVSEPKHVDEVYSTLPQAALNAIARRDGKNMSRGR